MPNVKEILAILKNTYPKAKIVLNYHSPWELLVAVILSAQCTDKKVNQITQTLFKKYKSLDDYTKAEIKEFEKDIRPAGFYRNKAKNILTAAKIVKEKFNGMVPKSMPEILTLPGVARKTANVVLGNAYGIVEGIAVDTHMIRINQRLGLTKNNDPVKIERDLMRLIPKDRWFSYTYEIIDFGRSICDAKKPRCEICPINKICSFAFKTKILNNRKF
jgi:endonuclease-3